ncbi:unnamed protein product [Phytophthora fragariaefolia]|uniref:Unnamed protein product n=1 Tax=Phytophthora fragariaefolia TaxID=1490495 RepID=A0A9W6Y8L3_9STRA|nr:unnamed protein product [Phytophthora fragariaefolia]
MAKLRRASYAATSAELPVLKTLGLEEADPEDVFELQRKEGAGAFGRVFRACYKNDRSCLAALKVIPVALEAGERGEDIESVRREIQFLRECDHPNVVAFHGAYYKDGALWVAMEHCAGGSVGDVRRVRSLSEREISVIMRGALNGLAYLHSRRKIHRDVKGGNILLTDSGQVKIADFGVSAQLRDTMSRRGSFVGTPYWMSPELIQDCDYDFKADIWSLGITAIELADQKPPLFDEHPMRVLIQIPRNPPPQVAHPDKWSPAFLDFLRFCLRKDPAERPTALECMQHEFIRREAHIEHVFASGEKEPSMAESGLSAQHSDPIKTADNSVAAVAAPPAPAPTVEQELEEEIAEEIRGSDSSALSEASGSPRSKAEDDGEASTGLLGETFEFRESVAQSTVPTSLAANASADTSSSQMNSTASTDAVLNLSAGPIVPDDIAQVMPQRQQQNTTSTFSFHSPPTEFKLLPSSAKSPVIRGNANRDSPIFTKAPDTSRIPSGPPLSHLSSVSDIKTKNIPKPSVVLRPKESLSPPPSPSMSSSWLSASSRQDDPLASIDSLTSARVNQLLSSISSKSSRNLVATLNGNNDQCIADDALSRSAARQSFNWRSVEAALPSSNPATSPSFLDKVSSTASNGKIFVGDPFRASHNVCVKYNSVQAQYHGVPVSAEWAALHQQFGIALSHVRCRSSKGQNEQVEDKVPALLRMLRRELVRHGGLRCKYIYRVSPVQEEVQRSKPAINSGSFDPSQVSDPHIYASLLKLWLRELPNLLLDELDVQDLLLITKLVNTGSHSRLEADAEGQQLVTSDNYDLVDAHIAKILQKLGPRENAVFLWLLDHMLEVNTHRSSNQMTTQALATVMAPNLFSCTGVARASQEQAGNLVRQVVTFVRVMLSWRCASLGNSPTASTFLLEQEEKAIAAVFSVRTEEPVDKHKVSTLQERVRQSVTRITKSAGGPEHENDSQENVSLEVVFRSCVDRLWSDLENSEVTTVETQRQENALRHVFNEFQLSMLQLIARHSKRTAECTWAKDLLDKIKDGQQLVVAMPLSLWKMGDWVRAALNFEDFCRLLDREQTVQDKLDRIRARFGEADVTRGNMNQIQGSEGAIVYGSTRPVFQQLTRIHQRHIDAEWTITQDKSSSASSNQCEDSCASVTTAIMLNGVIRLANSTLRTGDDLAAFTRQHRNVSKVGERQPAIGNLLALFGDCDQKELHKEVLSLCWLQQLRDSKP